MFCRFGSLELSRPVAATTWLNEAWIRPSGVGQAGQGVEIGALELGELAVLGSGAGAAGAWRPALRGPRCAVLGSPPGVFLERGELQLVEEDLPELRAASRC